MVFQSGSNVLLENVMIDFDCRHGLAKLNWWHAKEHRLNGGIHATLSKYGIPWN